jgi:nitroimidazol reductase NimA-like FMN-containing flavoprotein (pyridoxamine 5'-phosphate oxidase superfamily)
VICRIGLCSGNVPYVVPMNFGYQNRYLYLHSAPQGRKIEMLKANRNVCFELETDVELLRDPTACGWGTRYSCVIGQGRASFVEDYQDKVVALDVIMRHYDPDTTFQYPLETVNRLAVIKIAIEKMSGKRSIG